MNLLEEAEDDDTFGTTDEFVDRLWDVSVAFVESLELEEVVLDDSVMYEPATRDRHEHRTQPAGKLGFFSMPIDDVDFRTNQVSYLYSFQPSSPHT